MIGGLAGGVGGLVWEVVWMTGDSGGSGLGLDSGVLGGRGASWRGKVRDVWDLGGNRLMMVASDRISAFDHVLPTAIPDKGRILTGLSAYWFGRLGVAHHLVSTRASDSGLALSAEERAWLRGRTMIARRARVVGFECVARGYLAGSGWAEYRARGTVCGERVAGGLRENDRLPRPMFTPARKASTGHDENVSFDAMAAALGGELAETLRARTLELYERGAARAAEVGLILADTKFEWGHDAETGELLLVDEALTPDSSRYWEANDGWTGGPRASFDKQYVRDWLSSSGWDRESAPPALPAEVVAGTRARYVEAFERLTGGRFADWASGD